MRGGDGGSKKWRMKNEWAKSQENGKRSTKQGQGKNGGRECSRNIGKMKEQERRKTVYQNRFSKKKRKRKWCRQRQTERGQFFFITTSQLRKVR